MSDSNMKAFLFSFFSILKVQILIHICLGIMCLPVLYFSSLLFAICFFVCSFLAGMFTVVLISYGLGGHYKYTTDTGLRIGRIKIIQENIAYFEGASIPFGLAALAFGLFVQFPFMMAQNLYFMFWAF